MATGESESKTGLDRLLEKERKQREQFLLSQAKRLLAIGEEKSPIGESPYIGIRVGNIDHPLVRPADDVYIRTDSKGVAVIRATREGPEEPTTSDRWSYVADFSFSTDLLRKIEGAVDERLRKAEEGDQVRLAI